MKAQHRDRIIAATTATFSQAVLASNTPVAVDFWAPW